MTNTLHITKDKNHFANIPYNRFVDIRDTFASVWVDTDVEQLLCYWTSTTKVSTGRGIDTGRNVNRTPLTVECTHYALL